MPSLTTLVVVAVMSWVLIAESGPAMPFILTRGINHGRRAALRRQWFAAGGAYITLDVSTPAASGEH